jgi:hypothetical protein
MVKINSINEDSAYYNHVGINHLADLPVVAGGIASTQQS